MSERGERAAEWMYRGVWRVLTNCFKVPEQPPTLPADSGDFIKSFHPSPRYLSYLKLYFWIVLFVVVSMAVLGMVDDLRKFRGTNAIGLRTGPKLVIMV